MAVKAKSITIAGTLSGWPAIPIMCRVISFFISQSPLSIFLVYTTFFEQFLVAVRILDCGISYRILCKNKVASAEWRTQQLGRMVGLAPLAPAQHVRGDAVADP